MSEPPAASGEEKFLRDIYPLLRRIARRIQPRRQDVNDFAQIAAMAVLRLYRRLGKRPEDAMIGTAARREMIDHIRTTVRKTPAVSMPLNEEIAGLTPSYQPRPEDAIIRQLDLERAIRMAPPAEQRVLRESLAGKTLDEIAEAQGVSRSRICQIRSAAIKRIHAERKNGGQKPIKSV